MAFIKVTQIISTGDSSTKEADIILNSDKILAIGESAKGGAIITLSEPDISKFGKGPGDFPSTSTAFEKLLRIFLKQSPDDVVKSIGRGF